MTTQQDLGTTTNQPELDSNNTPKKTTTARKKTTSPKKSAKKDLEPTVELAKTTPKTKAKKNSTETKERPAKATSKTSKKNSSAKQDIQKTVAEFTESNPPEETKLPNLALHGENTPDSKIGSSQKSPKTTPKKDSNQSKKTTGKTKAGQKNSETGTSITAKSAGQAPATKSASAEKKSRSSKRTPPPKTQMEPSGLAKDLLSATLPVGPATQPEQEEIAKQPASKSPQKAKVRTSTKKTAAQKADLSKILETAGEGTHSPEATPPETSVNLANNTQPIAKEIQKDHGHGKDTPAAEEKQNAKTDQNKKKTSAKTKDSSLETEITPVQGEEKSSSSKKASRKQHHAKKTAQENPLQEATASSAKTGEATQEPAKGKEPEAAVEQAKEIAKHPKSPRRKMFVCVQPEEQVEVALTEEGQVQEYYVEMFHQMATKGNIYKGIIHNIDNNLQAAFINYGAAKNGFLQIDEVHPEYYNVTHEPNKGRKYPPIQKVLQPGQEVLVQVVKEPSGTKGAFLTTYLSIPGRFLVLTPGSEQIGVSRKVENEAERARLRDMLEGLTPDPGLGVIVRTVSIGTSKENLEKDLEYLQRIWKEVRTKGSTLTAPTLIYQEHDLATRAIRDYLTDAVTEIWVDDPQIANAVEDTATALFPKKRNLVRVHTETTPLFERFNLQKQIDQLQTREVSLPSGGRLVIDATEALTAIDINSGRSSGKNNFEDMAYRTNLEAAKIIPLQLRLRDIGGQIVIDFIEMRNKNHWRDVEKTLRQGMKNDRARFDIGKISVFGLQEIVRQRLGTSALSISTEPCPHCKGTGVRRNMEWQCQQALREMARLLRNAANNDQKHVIYAADPELALQLLNSKRQRLTEMEQQWNIHLEIRFKHAFPE